MRSLVPLLLLACGAAPAASQAPAASPTPTPPTASTQAGSASPPPEPGRPLDVVNHCTKEITVRYGDAPTPDGGTKLTVASGATGQVPRAKNATVAVWIVGQEGAMASVVVTPRMRQRQVEIGASCSTLDAR